MAYKTILVHLNNEQRVARLIGAATRLASSATGHLTGLYVIPQLPTRATLLPLISDAVIKPQLEAFCKMGERIHGEFERVTANLPFVAEWQLVRSEQPNYVDAVLGRARTADLVIASQKESDWDLADMFDIPDWLAIESGRPVLVVPTSGKERPIGERILVAWNNSRESARAVFDALPLLVSAKEVHVLVVEEPGKPQTSGELPGAEICAALARHGVNCIAERVKYSAGLEPGAQLLAQVEHHNCDLLVMGCYGRSRFREFVLGGASRHVLRSATVPVLLAH